MTLVLFLFTDDVPQMLISGTLEDGHFRTTTAWKRGKQTNKNKLNLQSSYFFKANGRQKKSSKIISIESSNRLQRYNENRISGMAISKPQKNRNVCKWDRSRDSCCPCYLSDHSAHAIRTRFARSTVLDIVCAVLQTKVSSTSVLCKVSIVFVFVFVRWYSYKISLCLHIARQTNLQFVLCLTVLSFNKTKLI